MDTHETPPKKKVPEEEDGLKGFYHPLEKAAELDTAGEGHPLNIMESLYYESSSESFHEPESKWKKDTEQTTNKPTQQ